MVSEETSGLAMEHRWVEVPICWASILSHRRVDLHLFGLVLWTLNVRLDCRSGLRVNATRLLFYRLPAPDRWTRHVIWLVLFFSEDPYRGFQISMMNSGNKGPSSLCITIKNDYPNLIKSKKKNRLQLIPCHPHRHLITFYFNARTGLAV